MSKKRKTREQKLHAQEKRLKSVLSPSHGSSHPTYSITLDSSVKTAQNSVGTPKTLVESSPVFVITDLYRSLITASTILVLSALLSLVIKRTNFLSLF